MPNLRIGINIEYHYISKYIILDIIESSFLEVLLNIKYWYLILLDHRVRIFKYFSVLNTSIKVS